MQDLSQMAAGSLSVTGQAYGVVQPAGQGLDAAGSAPAAADAGAPAVTVSDRVPAGTPGSRILTGYNPAAVTWKNI